MSSDFSVIDEVTVLESKHVRLVPLQKPGKLFIIKDHEELSLVWEMDNSFDSRRLPMTEVLSLVPDFDSSTLLIMSKNAPNAWLFHFLRDSPKAFVSELYQYLSPLEVERLPVVANGKTIACLGDDTRPAELDDIGFNLLNTFSKVTKFYSNTASRILGLNSYELRPRSKSPRLFPKNPWITERALDLPPSRRIPTQLSSLIWRSFLEDNGTIPQPEALRQLIHQSGCSQEIRPAAWRFIFDLRLANMSDQDYQKHLENLQCEFQRIVELTDIIKISEEMRSRIGTTLKAMLQYSPDLFSSLDKDVFRTDRLIDYYHPNPSTIEQDLKSGSLRILQQILLAYHAYDPDLEYVQGMADLLSPILYILRDETETFWIFAKFMERQRCNFTIDGKGVQEKIDKIEGILKLLDPQFYDFLGFQKDSSQLLFCYRWLLVLFKREFSFHDTLLIWEVILTAPVTDYEVYISVAILLMAKQTIMDNCRDFGEILTHLSEFTKHLSVFEVLSKTDRILHFIQTDPHLRTLIENRRFQP